MSTTYLIAIIQVTLITLIEVGCIIADIISTKKCKNYYDHELLVCCIIPTITQILTIVYFISESIKGNL